MVVGYEIEGDFTHKFDTMGCCGCCGFRMTFLILIVMAAFAVLQKISAMRSSLMRNTIA